MNPLPFLLTCVAGWMNHRQQLVIEYLEEEIRVLQEHVFFVMRLMTREVHFAGMVPEPGQP